MSAKIKEINVPVNNHCFSTEIGNENYSNEKSHQKFLEKIYYSNYPSLYIDTNNQDKFKQIIIYNFRKSFKEDDNKFIYQVEKQNDKYLIKTGLYAGYINLGNNITIVINSGYDEAFFKRMLNFVGNVYFDTSSNNTSFNQTNFLTLIYNRVEGNR